MSIAKRAQSGAEVSHAGLRQNAGLYPMFEFHVLRSVRNEYGFEDALFSLTGNVVFVNYHAVRVFAHVMNMRRPSKPVRTGALNAMGLIDEIYHYVVQLYESTVNPGVFRKAIDSLETTIGEKNLQPLLMKFIDLFPPTSVYRNSESIASYLGSGTMGKANREILLEELMHVYFANFNPAFKPFRELFEDNALTRDTPYARSIEHLEKFFQSQPRFGPNAEDIFTFLRAPILACPDSIEGQLDYIRKHWGGLLTDLFLGRMTRAGDLIKEEFRFVEQGGGISSARVPRYTADESAEYLQSDEERFTPDIDWMPNVVLLAKNTYVWLDQLSKKYRRPIRTLDQIPDEELDQIAQWHFTALWLIGIWERCRASQRIKQMTGNPEAVASAYSLYDYDIAQDLGGDNAFQQLRARAWHRGIRLAGDMVPNHVGLYSRWVIEHPEYFIQSAYPPYPNYRFSGEDLSDHPSIELRIEDSYWSRSDAAVVFQRIDRASGRSSYIYHGNDGTSMPWNDTAQLNFLRGDVREAVIQTIIQVARKFPIIRFDAAMVLAKKHFQRLWYPEPGSGGAIPSRSDFAMSRSEFDMAFPKEFWREVVDRINAEMPDTLLLAEAFWLLEGYFVRTLGMHRVYNSAFMHMLMKEENSRYRELIRNTLHYNPEILKRYVNFMSNPDEKTAVEQFGKGDKYFGIATLMVTLPGLPMFGHGQIEGYSEKYGMEYRRAYYDEYPDQEFMRRHEREIFPLMNRRHLFSQVYNFELYDFVTKTGKVDENVFVYSNRSFGERVLIFYNNRYGETEGSVNFSVGKTQGDKGGEIHGTTIAQHFGFRGDGGVYYVFKDFYSDLEFLRSGRTLYDRGFPIHLGAYECRVFLDIREIRDDDGIISRLSSQIGLTGIPNIWDAAKRLRLQGVHDVFVGIFKDPRMTEFVNSSLSGAAAKPEMQGQQEISNRIDDLVGSSNQFMAAKLNHDEVKEKFFSSFGEIGSAARTIAERSRLPRRKPLQDSVLSLVSGDRDRFLLGLWLLLKNLTAGRDELSLDDAVRRLLRECGYQGEEVENENILLHILLNESLHQKIASGENLAPSMVDALKDADVRAFINVHEYNGLRYYNKEAFERLVIWLAARWWINRLGSLLVAEICSESDRVVDVVRRIFMMSDASGYKLDDMETTILESESMSRSL